MKESWRCLDTGAQTGALNMALDESLVARVEGGGTSVLRFYGWNPPAISLGYAQSADGELDVDACRAAGVDIVRRPTGGRAVLHWQELTYSAIFAAPSEPFGARIEQTYSVIGECLVAGLRRFGADVELERAHVRSPRPRRGTAALPCFSSIARSEVKWRGRKLVGSAQRRFAGAILQHGSIVIGPAHEQLVDCLRLDEARRAQWRARLRADSTCLQECVGGAVERSELVECMIAGFSEVLGRPLATDQVQPEEWALSRARANFWNVEARSAKAVN